MVCFEQKFLYCTCGIDIDFYQLGQANPKCGCHEQNSESHVLDKFVQKIFGELNYKEQQWEAIIQTTITPVMMTKININRFCYL